MVKFARLLVVLALLFPAVAPALEFDSDNDGVFDSDFKFDVDSLYDGGAVISAPALTILKAASYAAMRTALDLEAGTDFYSISAADALLAAKQNASTAATDSELTNGLATKQDASTAATDTELSAHSADTDLHNGECTAASGDCGEVYTGNTVTYTRTISAGECHRWQEYSAGNWVWYRQCYGEATATEERQDWVRETGNYTLFGSWDHTAGEITVPTQSLSDNSQNAANTSWVVAYVASVLGASGVDAVPDAFSFTDVTDGNITTEYDDNITVVGITSTAPIAISGDGGEYQINAGSRTSSPGSVALNDVVTVYLTSSGLNSTATNTTLNIGGVTDTFTITTVAGGGSACAGDVIFDWTMTSDFLSSYDISTSGGCTVGDGTILLESSASGETSPAGRTGYSLYIPGSYDTASFDIGTGASTLFYTAEGTITFDIYVSTWANSAWVIGAIGLANSDQFQLELYNDNELRLSVEGANAGPVRATTTTADLATGTWYSGVIKWREGATDPSISVAINGSTSTATTDLTTWTTAPTELNLGNPQGATGAYYIKNVRIYNSWQE